MADRYTIQNIYNLYLEKVEKKGKTKDELDTVLFWLTGYDKKTLQKAFDDELSLREFIENAPKLNPNRSLIKGLICGIRVENIEDSSIQEIRYMDKLVDELAKGKQMKSISRPA